MKYLLQFLIGSSVFVFIWFFIFINKRIHDKKLYTSYFNYTLVMPIFFGISNVFNWIGENSIMLNLTVDNLLDEEYISTIGYPEPGRSIKFTLEYRL